MISSTATTILELEQLITTDSTQEDNTREQYFNATNATFDDQEYSR